MSDSAQDVTIARYNFVAAHLFSDSSAQVQQWSHNYWHTISGDGGDDGGEDFHQQANKKRRQSLEFLLTGASAMLTLGTAAIAEAPIDCLSNRLQHLDSTGGAMMELTQHGPEGCLAQCQRKYWEVNNPWSEGSCNSHLPTLLWHLGSEPDLHVVDELRSRTVGLAAAVWSRLELRYHWWPWRLFAGLIMSMPDRRALYAEFFATPKCCLDDWFGRPLRDGIPNLEYMFTADFVMALTTLSRRLKATNMGLESDISEIRAATPVAKRCPNAEKVCYLAHLHALLKAHLSAGGLDSRGQIRRDELLAMGVPLEQRRDASYKRPDMTWQNIQLWRWRNGNPLASQDTDGVPAFTCSLSCFGVGGYHYIVQAFLAESGKSLICDCFQHGVG
jgi:hypothetical protein